MTRPVPTFRLRIFGALARLDVRRPWTVLAAAVILSALCVFYTRQHLEFQTGQDDLITANNRDSQNYLRYSHEFPDLDGLIIVIKAKPSTAHAELFADTLAKRLLADRANVKSVFYRIDAGLMGDRALLYLGVDKLNELNSRIHEHLPLLRAYAADPTLAAFFALTNAQIDAAMGPAMRSSRGAAGISRDELAAVRSHSPALSRMRPDDVAVTAPANSTHAMDFSFLDSLLAGMLAGSAASPPSPWAGLSPVGEQDGGLRDGYLVSDNGKFLLMHVAPGDGAAEGPHPVEAIQADLDAVRAKYPSVEAGMTGGPALAYAEETTTAHDMALASIIAVASNIALIVIPFRGVVEPLFAILALFAGVTWSFGFTTLAVGHLNLLSAVFTSVLAGIGINFPIHLMARYDEARRHGHTMPEALELAVVNTGTGVFASACIMALAFLTPMFTDFKGIAELGLVSAAGLFMCLLSAMLVFPALIALRDRNRTAPLPPQLSMAPSRSFLEKLFARPGVIVGVSVVATLAATFLVRGVGFDQNILKLQAGDAEAVRYENILLRDSGRSSWFAVALAPTRDAAEREAATFRELPEVSDVETITTYLPDHQAEKRAILNALRADVAPIAIRAPAPAGNSPALARNLSELAYKLDALARMARSSDAGKTADAGKLADAEKTAALVHRALDRLKAGPNVFAGYERRIASDLNNKLTILKRELSPVEVTEANLPRVLRERFIGTSGAYLVQIYPRGDVWEDAPLAHFVTTLKTVDRDVTGPPVQTYNMASVMRHGYERAAVLALIAVFVFVFADFRNLRDAILATVPLVFGGAWLLEAMGALGWEFNLANLFAVPIIIGMGVDNGVNMLYRWREERDKSSLILTKAVGKSVTICSLTTIAAFAALITANHRGISSLGWVLSLGVGFILLATFIVLPALFELLGARIPADEAPPEDASEEPPRRIAGAGM